MNAQSKKVSIITPVFNRENVIGRCMSSVRSQLYPNIEHILVDGQSVDRTLSEIRKRETPGQIVISERDDGLYDAINKGIGLASGDIIGILNSDDIFASSEVVSKMVSVFEDNPGINGVFGDVEYFVKGDPGKVMRRYISQPLSRSNLAKGLMPAHPTIYLSRSIYEQVGNYRKDYKIASDFEFVARAFVMNVLSMKKIESILVRMESGGVSNSSIGARFTINSEILRACRDNGIETSLMSLLGRYPAKLVEYAKGFMRL